MNNKLEEKYENPIDIILIRLAHKIKGFFYTFNFIPNHITTLSLIFGLLSIYLLYKNKYKLSILCFAIGYFFDILDGVYARSYDMVTVFGDYYDHISDVLIIGLFLFMIIYKCNNRTKLIPYMILCCICGILTFIHIGCQENIYNSIESDSLTISKKLCSNPLQKIKYSRFFGCGTFMLLLIMITLISEKILKKNLNNNKCL